MSSLSIEERIDKAHALLQSTTALYEQKLYDDAERCAQEALGLVESESACADYGDERNETSLLYRIVRICAWAYNRLLTVAIARRENERALLYTDFALAYARRIDDASRICDVLVNKGSLLQTGDDYDGALLCFSEALEISKRMGFAQSTALAHSSLGIFHLHIGNYDKALEELEQCLAQNELNEDARLIAGAKVNIGAVLMHMKLYDKALEYYARGLQKLEALGDKPYKAVVLGNIGALHAHRHAYDLALEFFGRALALYDELEDPFAGISNVNNIGVALKKLGRHDEAMEYYGRALGAYKQYNDSRGIALILGNIGSLYADPRFDGYNAAKAEEHILKAIALDIELSYKSNRLENEESLCQLYEREGRWEDYARHLRLYVQLKDELLSDEAREQAQRLEQRQRMATREKEMQIEKAQAEAEMRATTAVLHKVLPASIATRLIRGEKVADYFDNISILFADIVGFTPIAASMPADAVLAFLNHVFGEFDRIMETHGCQKIKTMGDGYMAVCGAPLPCDDHAERLTRAALELLNDLVLPDDIRSSLPKGSVFHLRIGLHCGPAFGGVVGERGFVYDVYSDAVNLAARMESHGEPGRVHCSEEFALHLTNRDSRFVLEPRGDVDIKGKGMMKTYFLQR